MTAGGPAAAADVTHTLFVSLFATIWLGWFILWRLMAGRVKAAAQSETRLSRLSHLVPLILAGCLLTFPVPGLDGRYLPPAIWIAALGVVVALAGLLVCVWARFTLAGEWSGWVEIKVNHELVVDGPYAFVRHPIYAGLLLMFMGSALAVGEWRAVLAVALAAASFWRKLRLEEAVMRRQFGDAYDRYAERTPALIPLVL